MIEIKRASDSRSVWIAAKDIRAVERCNSSSNYSLRSAVYTFSGEYIESCIDPEEIIKHINDAGRTPDARP